jgi:hypothetical protein
VESVGGFDRDHNLRSNCSEPVFLNVYGVQESIQGMNSASLCNLASRYVNPISPRFLAPIDSLKIPTLYPCSILLAEAGRISRRRKLYSTINWLQNCANTSKSLGLKGRNQEIFKRIFPLSCVAGFDYFKKITDL